MNAPDKIYIAETPNKLIEIWSDEPIESKPYIKEHEYIRKEALLEWAKEHYDRLKFIYNATPSSVVGGKMDAYKEIINKIKSL